MLEVVLDANKHMFTAITHKYGKVGGIKLYASEVTYAQRHLVLQKTRDLDKDGVLVLRALDINHHDPKELSIDE